MTFFSIIMISLSVLRCVANLLVLICFQLNRKKQWPHYAINLKFLCVNNCLSGFWITVRFVSEFLFDFTEPVEDAFLISTIAFFSHESLQILFMFVQQATSFSYTRKMTQIARDNCKIRIVHGVLLLVAVMLACLPFVIWDVRFIDVSNIPTECEVPPIVLYASCLFGIPAMLCFITFIIMVVKYSKARRTIAPELKLHAMRNQEQQTNQQTTAGDGQAIASSKMTLHVKPEMEIEQESQLPTTTTTVLDIESGMLHPCAAIAHTQASSSAYSNFHKDIANRQTNENSSTRYFQKSSKQKRVQPYFPGRTVGQKGVMQTRMLALKNLGILLALNSSVPTINFFIMISGAIFSLGYTPVVLTIALSSFHIESTLNVFNLLFRYKLVRDAFLQMLQRWKNQLCNYVNTSRNTDIIVL